MPENGCCCACHFMGEDEDPTIQCLFCACD